MTAQRLSCILLGQTFSFFIFANHTIMHMTTLTDANRPICQLMYVLRIFDEILNIFYSKRHFMRCINRNILLQSGMHYFMERHVY